MELSIIVAVYNVEAYLKRCLDSILKSTYPHFEILVVNDGSSDNCGNIIDEYALKDQRIIAIHQTNMGVSIARNNALDKAKGKYLLFVDGDDYISNNMIAHLMEYASDYDFVETTQFFANEMKSWRKPYQTNQKINDVDLQEKLDALLYITLAPHSRIYKAALFKELRFPPCLVFEDNFLISAMFLKIKKVKKLELESGYYHYQRQGSTTLSYTPKMYDMLSIQKLIYDYYIEQDCLSRYYLILERNALRALVVSLLGRKMAFMANDEMKKQKYAEIVAFVNTYYPNYQHNKYIPFKEKCLCAYLLKSYQRTLLFHRFISLVKK